MFKTKFKEFSLKADASEEFEIIREGKLSTIIGGCEQLQNCGAFQGSCDNLRSCGRFIEEEQ